MIRALAEKYPGKLVPLLGDVRGGITANMNRGLSACDGKYIAFLGGDDIFLPGKIRKQVMFMQAHPEVVPSHHDVDVFNTATDATLYLWSQRYGKHTGGADSVGNRAKISSPVCPKRVSSTCPILNDCSRRFITRLW